mgnify:CR=1 FL=1
MLENSINVNNNYMNFAKNFNFGHIKTREKIGSKPKITIETLNSIENIIDTRMEIFTNNFNLYGAINYDQIGIDMDLFF